MNSIVSVQNFPITFRSARGRGGLVEDITYSHIRMYNQYFTAIDLDLMFHQNPPTNATATPVFRNINFNNIYSSGAKRAWRINGLPESYFTNVTFSDIEVVNATTLFTEVNYIHCTCVRVLPSCPQCT